MNKIICIGLTGFVLLMLATAAVSPPTGAIAPYEREQTKGNVRVVLLKVERATFFTTQNIRDAKPGKVYPVSTIGVTYMVEALGNDPIKNWHEDHDDNDITMGNHPIGDFDTLPQNVTPEMNTGTLRPVSSYANGPEELPKSFDKKRVSVQEIHVRTGSGLSAPMNLTLKVGFNDHPETFVFKNLPVN